MINDFLKAFNIIDKNGSFILLITIGTILGFILPTSFQPNYVLSLDYYMVNILILFIIILFNSVVLIIIINKTRNTLFNSSLINTSGLLKKLFFKILLINIIFSILISITGLTFFIGIYFIPLFIDLSNNFNIMLPFVWFLAFPCFIIFIFTINSMIIKQNSITSALKETSFLLQRISLKTVMIIVIPIGLNLIFMFTIPLLTFLTSYPAFIYSVILATCAYIDITDNKEIISKKIIIPKIVHKKREHTKIEPIKIAQSAIPRPVSITPPDEIKLCQYNIKNVNKSFKALSVGVDDVLQSETERIDDINRKLKEEASPLGANAVMNVKYRREIRFGLGKVIEGSGQPIYIENTENIIKTAPKGTIINIILGICWITVGLFNDYNTFRFALYYLLGLSGIYTIFTVVSMWRGYANKTYYLGLFTLTAIYGIKLFYNVPITVFQISDSWFNFSFRLSIAFYILLVSVILFKYKYRKNDLNMPWKDKWGF